MNRKDLIANVIICPKQKLVGLPVMSATYISETGGTVTASNRAWKTYLPLNALRRSIPGNDQPRGVIRSSPRSWATGRNI